MAVSGLLVVVAVFAPLVLLVNPNLALPGLVVLAVWYFWFLPSHRKRVRRIFASLPRWEIKETPPGGTVSPPG